MPGGTRRLRRLLTHFLRVGRDGTEIGSLLAGKAVVSGSAWIPVAGMTPEHLLLVFPVGRACLLSACPGDGGLAIEVLKSGDDRVQVSYIALEI